MPDAHVEPLSSWPQTRVFKTPDGLLAFRVAPNVLTPLRARLADQIGEALWWVAMLWMVYAFLSAPEFKAPHGPDISITTLLAVGAFILRGEWLLAALARLALRRRTEIEMTVDAISVRSGLLWRRYARLLEHRFTLEVHDHAEQERRDYDKKVHRATTTKVPPFVPYYGDSLHVVLRYAGQRADLLTVYGPKQADAIRARLELCDRLLNDAIKMSGGISQKPGDDWTDAPGGL